jgi:hypothetical protein
MVYNSNQVTTLGSLSFVMGHQNGTRVPEWTLKQSGGLERTVIVGII